jgi:co-chaperonin GroES (HSP10)
MKLTTQRLKKLIREELNEMSRDSGGITLSEGSSHKMKDGTEFQVGTYRSNSGEKTLKVKVDYQTYLVGDVSKEEEIISQLKSMNLKQAKEYGGPLFARTARY